MDSLARLDAMFELVASGIDPRAGLRRLRAMCAHAHPSPAWFTLPEPDIDVDVELTKLWLHWQLGSWQVSRWSDEEGAPPPPLGGIFLAVSPESSLHADAPWNVKIAATDDLDAPAWPRACTWHGTVEEGGKTGGYMNLGGLDAMMRVWSTPPFAELHTFAAITLGLGYTGLVFSRAFEKLHAERAFAPPYVVSWSLIDGDARLLLEAVDDEIQRCAGADLSSVRAL